MIKFQNLNYLYGDGDTEQTKTKEPGIFDVNTEIALGECVLLCGVSGCGKTTLTKTVNGLIPYFDNGRLDGIVTVAGVEVKNTPMYELAKKVASVFQNPKSQFFNTDAESEITFALENQGITTDEIETRLTSAVKDLGITHLMGKSIFDMSGGEKQIIAFAGAYASNAKVVVLDEPSANLDARSTHKISEIIKTMKRDGKTILITEHRISYLSELIDRVIYIEHGRIKKAFTSKEFFCMTEDERKTMGLRRLTSQDITSIENRYNTPTVANTLEIRGLSLTYGKHTILHDINFSLKSGDCVGIVGKNGTGKSTLSRFLCGLHKQRSGGVFLDGKPLRIKDRRRLCGIVMQDVNYQLFSDSVYGECLLGNGKISKGKVDDILKNLNLYEFRDIHPQSLSGGQKQRLAIATALASDKKILILDEPTSGLDYTNMIAVAELLKKLTSNGMICIVVTHDTEFLQAACNRCLWLKDDSASEINKVNSSIFE